MILFFGVVIGFLFWKVVSGKYEGDKIERSFRFNIINYYIHIHHWIWCSVVLVALLILNYQNMLIFGVLIGSIIQGLLYKDRFVVVYKKKDFEKIYSKFKQSI
jgi:hypothetical protein